MTGGSGEGERRPATAEVCARVNILQRAVEQREVAVCAGTFHLLHPCLGLGPNAKHRVVGRCCL